MSEELVRGVEIGVAGIVVTLLAYLLGLFRMELLGVVFSLTTLAGQSVVAFLEQFGAPPIGPGPSAPPS
jgi:hypothetical protein